LSTSVRMWCSSLDVDFIKCGVLQAFIIVWFCVILQELCWVFDLATKIILSFPILCSFTQKYFSKSGISASFIWVKLSSSPQLTPETKCAA
jgi:hypothetical protein